MNTSQSDGHILKNFDKILFGVASIYFLLVLIWIFNQISKPKQAITQKPVPSPADAQFIAYLQQSLNVINKKSTQKTLVNPEQNKLSTVPVVPVAPTTPEKVIERIYVPMYPPNQTPSNPPTIKPPTPQINNIPPSPPLPSTASPPSPVPVVTPGQTLFPVPPEVAANTQPSANASHQLVGLLESGERSTAIFTFNGVSRRFEIGETVGNSGAILMGVQNQKAIVYQNGQTKYLEVGQAF